MQAASRHTIASYVASPSLAPGSRAALERLGYELAPAVSRGRFDDASWPADIRLVDERHLDRVPRDATPVVVLARDPARRYDNERVVGVVGRPAALEDLYPIFQRTLEEHPRRAARAQTSITARGSIEDRRFDAELVTLSAWGARLATPHALASGTCINLGFPLPCEGLLSLRARVCAPGRDHSAIEFMQTPFGVRRAIAGYVQRRLATG